MQQTGGRRADLGDERAGLQVVARREYRPRFPRGLERELADIERVIRLLQVPGEGFYREGEPQERLDEPYRRCSSIAHQHDGGVGEHAGVARGRVELVGGNGVVTRAIEVSPARRSVVRYLIATATQAGRVLVRARYNALWRCWRMPELGRDELWSFDRERG